MLETINQSAMKKNKALSTATTQHGCLLFLSCERLSTIPMGRVMVHGRLKEEDITLRTWLVVNKWHLCFWLEMHTWAILVIASSSDKVSLGYNHVPYSQGIPVLFDQEFFHRTKLLWIGLPRLV